MVSRMDSMDIATHLEALRREGTLLADTAMKAGVEAPVPTCPDWRVRDLLQHQGEIHRWAAANVAKASEEPLGREELAALVADRPDDPPGLDAWFREGHAALLATLESADPDLACWHFLSAPSGTKFWARRQAHETTIHRVDAEAAAGVATPIDPVFAADGIDELLTGFMARAGGPLAADPPRVLGVHATDTDDGWTVRIEADRRVVTRELTAADCTVSGPAAELYLLLWNRRSPDGLDVEGDRAVLDLWRERALIRWGN
jgi:uncharacterized protein (TIGR03083 family)